jgi:hypothetical protein
MLRFSARARARAPAPGAAAPSSSNVAAASASAAGAGPAAAALTVARPGCVFATKHPELAAMVLAWVKDHPVSIYSCRGPASWGAPQLPHFMRESLEQVIPGFFDVSKRRVAFLDVEGEDADAPLVSVMCDQVGEGRDVLLVSDLSRFRPDLVRTHDDPAHWALGGAKAAEDNLSQAFWQAHDAPTAALLGRLEVALVRISTARGSDARLPLPSIFLKGSKPQDGTVEEAVLSRALLPPAVFGNASALTLAAVTRGCTSGELQGQPWGFTPQKLSCGSVKVQKGVGDACKLQPQVGHVHCGNHKDVKYRVAGRPCVGCGET